MMNTLSIAARVSFVALLLNCMLFFRGCDAEHRSHYSLGVLIPYADVEVVNNSGLETLSARLLDPSAIVFVINAVAGLLLGAAFVRLPVARRAWWALFLACALNINLLGIRAIGFYVVLLPVLTIAGWLTRLTGAEPPVDRSVMPIQISIASRLWLAILFGLLYGMLSLLAFVGRYYPRSRSWGPNKALQQNRDDVLRY
jgi:hypothetical protein